MRIAAIDIGGTNISLGIYTEDFTLVGSGNVNSHEISSSQDLLAFIAETSMKFDVLGIACAGSVDSHKGIIHFAPNIDWLRDYPLKAYLENSLIIPVEIENDANCFVLGEANFGVCKGFDNIIGYTLGTGIGGGVIVDGKLLRGIGAAELGHVSIDINGLLCNCGKKGCLEAYCGGIWVQRFIEIIAQKHKMMVKPSNNLNASKLFELARSKDDFALNFWEEWGKIFGIGVAQVLNVLRPQAVVLGGKISRASEFFLPAMSESLHKHVFPPFDEDMQILISNLENSALLGAVFLAKQRLDER